MNHKVDQACRHAATITAAGKKHHRKNEQKDHDNGDQVAALIFSTVIGIKKKSSGDCNQRKIDQYIFPGTGPETEKGHDQADHSTSQGEDIEQPNAEIKGGTEQRVKNIPELRVYVDRDHLLSLMQVCMPAGIFLLVL